MAESDRRVADLDSQCAGRWVALHRRRKGLTQKELARRAWVRVPTVGNFERGLTSPGLGTIMDLVRALGVDPAEVFRADQRFPPGDGPRTPRAGKSSGN